MQPNEPLIEQVRIADCPPSGTRLLDRRVRVVATLAMALAAGLPLRAGPAAESAAAKAKDSTVAQSVQIEMEDFTLTDCVVSDLTNACGGKAVLIAKASSKAETTVKLPKGDYSVEFWMMAPSLESDTVWVTIGDAGKGSPWDGKCKAFPDHQRMPMKYFVKSGVYVDSKARVVVSVTEDMKELPVVISPKKTGMLIDRVVFKRLAAPKAESTK